MFILKMVYRIVFFWKTYYFWTYYLSLKDWLCARSKGSGIPSLHKKLASINAEHKQSWPNIYCAGYYYQGYEKICIHGIKPSEKRINKYEILELLKKSDNVLDIGSNCGFLACHLSDHINKITGIEINPFLIEIANTTKNHLSIDNAEFINSDFLKFESQERYDVVFSLSNHYTIDGNLNVDFSWYIQKISNMMNDGGYLFFESHDLNGDDRDMPEKIKIMEKDFEVTKFKMVKKFYPPDVDKLFLVLRKTSETTRKPVSFNVETVKNKYHY